MLDNVSPQILVAAATAVLTAVVTLSSVYLTSFGQRKAEEEKFKRSRDSEQAKLRKEQLEELYLLFSKWDADLASLGHLFFQAHLGVPNHEHPFIAANKNKLSESDYFYRILMMVDLRFPELKASFDEILQARDNVMSLCDEKLPSGQGPEDLAKALDAFRERSRSFKEKLALMANVL